MKYFSYIILTMISFGCLADSNNDAYEDFKALITDEVRTNLHNSYVEDITKDLPLAKSGDATAMYRLFTNINIYANLYRRPELFQSAFKWLKKSAELGNPDALNSLGHIYRNGSEDFNIEKDLYTSAGYFKASADTGNATGDFYYRDIVECELAEVKADDC